MNNINSTTGIRYGVVSMNSLQPWVWDEFFYKGRNLTLEAWEKENPDASDALDYEGEEEEYYLETDTLKLILGYLGGAPLIWVMESPFIARALLCSPCVPGAGDLDSQSDQGEECYTLPPEWWGEEGS